MKSQYTALFMALCFLISIPATTWADAPLGAPNTTLLIESEVLDGNQSNNLGPATQWVLDNFWEEGPCPEGDSFASCDLLRFGAATYGRATCEAGAEIHIFPKEDGGAPVKQFVNSNDTSSQCTDPDLRPLADGIYDLRETYFPGLDGADEADKEKWFEHPYLTLAIISELPQYGSSPEVQRALQAACDVRNEYIGEVPSMFLWAMVARQHNDDAVAFAHLLSAAGGTGQCCDRQGTDGGGPNCDPTIDAHRLDVCDHIEGRSDDDLRQDISTGRYRCATSQDSWKTGALDFETTGNNLPQITCHFNGLGPGTDNNPNVCDTGGRQATDLFGKFSCIRQIPREALHGDTSLRYCDAQGCELLSEQAGDFEYIDDNQSLISLNNDQCEAMVSEGGQITVDDCDAQGEPCETGLHGRCAEGYLACEPDGTLVCQPLRGPMPELCNGLDDSCDGQIDNVDTTIDDLPDEYQGLACFGTRSCVCPEGAEHAHYGHDLDSFVQGQEGLCQCRASQSLEPASTGTAEQPTTSGEAAGCSVAGDHHVPSPQSVAWLIAIVTGLLLRQRIIATS